jgi:RNA polymerase sigma-70 factor (ECF subfamily)
MTDFSSLYAQYAPEVFRFAWYLSGNRSDAEDLTSETFVRVWTSAAHVEMSTVRAYLFTIARNLYLQGLRRSRREGELSASMEDASPGPQVRAESRAELDAVIERLQRLPEVDRTALLMRALEGAAYEEIARALGITLASAKVKVHRARLSLAKVEVGK